MRQDMLELTILTVVSNFTSMGSTLVLVSFDVLPLTLDRFSFDMFKDSISP